MAQAPPMAQALLIVQTIHTHVPTSNTKERNFIIQEKFDGTQSKFCGFVQYINIFLRPHLFRYPDDSTQVAFIGSLLSGNAHSWFGPFLEKHLLVLQNMALFEAFFIATFNNNKSPEPI